MREMKDSGIEWIGEIPKDWCVKNGKYVFNVYGMSVNDDFISDTVEESYKIKYYKVDNLNEATEQFYVKSNFANFSIKIYEIKGPIILVPKRGGAIYTNKVRIEKEACLFDSNIMGLTTNNNVRFMAYVLYGRGLSDIGDVTTIPQINKKHIDVLKIPVPSINEQEVIVEYLDTKCSEIDATTEDIQKEISLLEDYKKSVITEAVTKGLNPDVEMKDSGIEWIGEIPKDWEFPKITHILDYTHPYPIGDGDHGTIKAENYSEEGIPFIRVQNLGFATELIMNNVVYITEKQNNGIINSTLYPNDILFAKTGATIGKVGIMPENIKKANTTSHVGKITVSEEVVPKYIFYVLSSFIGYKQFWDIALMKSTRPELSIDEIKTLHVLLPKTKEEQQQIADFLDTKCSEIDSLIADKKRQLDILADYKKSLIYEYVTGKKEVPVNE